MYVFDVAQVQRKTTTKTKKLSLHCFSPSKACWLEFSWPISRAKCQQDSVLIALCGSSHWILTIPILMTHCADEATELPNCWVSARSRITTQQSSSQKTRQWLWGSLSWAQASCIMQITVLTTAKTITQNITRGNKWTKYHESIHLTLNCPLKIQTWDFKNI